MNTVDTIPDLTSVTDAEVIRDTIDAVVCTGEIVSHTTEFASNHDGDTTYVVDLEYLFVRGDGKPCLLNVRFRRTEDGTANRLNFGRVTGLEVRTQNWFLDLLRGIFYERGRGRDLMHIPCCHIDGAYLGRLVWERVEALVEKDKVSFLKPYKKSVT